MFAIEKNVPVHPGGRPAKYPWRNMEIMDSFLVPCAPSERDRTFSRITSCKSNAERSTGFQFIIRCEEKGLRVWRVDDKTKYIVPRKQSIRTLEARARNEAEEKKEKALCDKAFVDPLMEQAKKCEGLRRQMTWRSA
jgi:hypothetical protein